MVVVGISPSRVVMADGCTGPPWPEWSLLDVNIDVDGPADGGVVFVDIGEGSGAEAVLPLVWRLPPPSVGGEKANVV